MAGHSDPSAPIGPEILLSLLGGVARFTSMFELVALSRKGDTRRLFSCYLFLVT
jgi:hypothetical protein